jgi:glycosyltransferase involved in cell wall biosynthesis
VVLMDGRMKILIVSNLYYPNIVGGAEAATQKAAESMASCCREVAIATLNPQRRYEVGEVNGVRVHYLPVWNIYFFGLPKNRRAVTKVLWHGMDAYNPLMAASLGRILDAERPDVVHTHNITGFSTSVWRAVKKRRLPLVHTVHDLGLLCPRGMFRDGKLCTTLCTACRVHSLPRRRLSRFVDVVTAVSRTVLDRCCRYGFFPESEKVVVYNSFEPEPDNGVQQDGRNGTLRFGYLGRLYPPKGADALVRSFLKLPDGRAELLIAGRGTSEYEADLRRLIGGRSTVRMLGFVAPSDFFSQVDVLVVPSLCHDAAPGAVLESMGHRVPLIASCRGGISELMGEGSGWVFDPGEPGALTRALQHAINSREELAAMGDRCAERARHFSLEATVHGYLQAYADAIDKNNKNP